MAKLKSPLTERLWSRVQVGEVDECWLWQGCLDTRGYGSLRFQGRLLSTHRVALEVTGRPAPPPPNNHALHSNNCSSRACCNPAHLRWGCNNENVADRVSFGRRNIGERHGSARLTEANVRAIRASTEPCPRLAERYNVGVATIQQARTGRTWRHLL